MISFVIVSKGDEFGEIEVDKICSVFPNNLMALWISSLIHPYINLYVRKTRSQINNNKQ